LRKFKHFRGNATEKASKTPWALRSQGAHGSWGIGGAREMYLAINQLVTHYYLGIIDPGKIP
jgi:hypothetical protein